MGNDAERERLFTAIELPDEVKDALLALAPRADTGIKPVTRERMHLTLHFIGDADPADVTRALSGVCAEGFELTISALGMFSRRGRPAALWAGVDSNERLHRLHAAIGEALAAAGCELDSRAYRPHVTLARLTPRADTGAVKAFLARSAIDPLEFAVRRFVLLSSRTGEEGPTYVRRAQFELDQVLSR